jgi:DNA helicase-2/ATP-dependent DNA helicase PcrA
MSVCTLHALGLRMLREHGDALGYTLDERRRRPSVLSKGESRAVLARAAREAAVGLLASGDRQAASLLERLQTDELADEISRYKSNGIPPEITASQDSGPTSDPVRRAIAICYAAYQASLKSANALDFDDLILQPLALLERPEVLSYFQARYQHAMVDEFQDVNAAQYKIVRRIASGHGNLTAIGDAAQSIYAFRGALGAIGFERFRQDFPNAEVVYLPYNFRSNANIVLLGDTLLADAKPYQVAMKVPGLPVALLRTASEYEEAALIAQELARATACGFVRYDECAVLCRTNAQTHIIERALLNAGVPYTVVGRGTFFEQPEIRHVLSYLRLSQDFMGDNDALRRIVNAPVRRLGPAEQALLRGDAPELTIQHLLDGARVTNLSTQGQNGVHALLSALQALESRRDEPPAVLIDYLLSDAGVGYQRHLLSKPDAGDRIDALRELWRIAKPFGTVGEFLDELDVMSGQDPLSPLGHERTSVMTLHDAKGLEFRLVFLAGMEEGRLPHYYDQGSRRGLEEERRLCYVGFSRAIDALCLTFARTRDGRETTPSRFLQGLPSAVISRQVLAWTAPRSVAEGRQP